MNKTRKILATLTMVAVTTTVSMSTVSSAKNHSGMYPIFRRLLRVFSVLLIAAMAQGHGRADGQCLYRVVQRQVPGRMSERSLVHEP